MTCPRPTCLRSRRSSSWFPLPGTPRTTRLPILQIQGSVVPERKSPWIGAAGNQTELARVRAHGKGQAVCKVVLVGLLGLDGVLAGGLRGLCLPGTGVVFTLVCLVLPACVSACAEGPCSLQVVCLVRVRSWVPRA